MIPLYQKKYRFYPLVIVVTIVRSHTSYEVFLIKNLCCVIIKTHLYYRATTWFQNGGSLKHLEK